MGGCGLVSEGLEAQRPAGLGCVFLGDNSIGRRGRGRALFQAKGFGWGRGLLSTERRLRLVSEGLEAQRPAGLGCVFLGDSSRGRRERSRALVRLGQRGQHFGKTGTNPDGVKRGRSGDSAMEKSPVCAADPSLGNRRKGGVISGRNRRRGRVCGGSAYPERAGGRGRR